MKHFKKIILLLLSIVIVGIIPQTIKATSSIAPNKIAVNFGEDASKEMLITWQNSITNQYLELASYADILYTQSQKVSSVVESFELDEYNYAQRYIHRVELSNLTPDTSYRFRVGNDEVLSFDYTFKTASYDEDFSFVFISDPQASTLEEFQSLSKVTNRAIFDDPNLSFFMLGGDIADIAGIEEQYNYFFTSFNALRKYPLISAIGNHDTMQANTNWKEVKNEARVYDAHFYNPQNGPSGVINSTYYQYFQNTLFITLNTQLDDALLVSQATWLDHLLLDNETNHKSRYIIVQMHRGVYGNYYYNNSTINLINSIYRPIFDKYSVDLVFSGHDHNYSRTGKLYNNQKVASIDGKGTVYIIGGTTGPKFNQPKSDSLYQFEAVASNVGVYTNIKVSKNKLTIIAKDENGNLIDQYYLPAKRGLNQNEIISHLKVTSYATSVHVDFDVNNLNFISHINIEKNDGTIIAQLNPYETSFHLSGLETDSLYKYIIRIVYKDLTSVIKQISVATTGFIQNSESNQNSIKISFTQNSSDISYYKLYLDDKFEKTLSKYYEYYYFINLNSRQNYKIKIESYNNSNLLIDEELTFIRTK